jgi:DNA-binding CsgD family transcriptional regulator
VSRRGRASLHFMADGSLSVGLVAALTVLRGPLEETLPRLSNVLGDVLPHDGIALLTGDCVLMAPLMTHNLDDVTADELGPLLGLVEVHQPWFGEISLGGIQRPVVAISIKPPQSVGALITIATTGRVAPPRATLETVHQLAELTILHLADLVTVAEPGRPARTPLAAVSDLADAHAVTLTGLLGVLRARRMDDATARRHAIELAVSALIEARSGVERDSGQQTASGAFAILADKLSLLTRYSDIGLELAAPEQQQRLLPGEVAQAARSVSRGAVLAMLQQRRVTRIRVAWQVADSELRMTIRDDGLGTMSPDALNAHRLHDRLVGLGGTLTVDATPDWGTTITAVLPLVPPEAQTVATLDVLNPREQDVLEELALGHRNRVVAQRLNISENTVKFHVANILRKLAVSTRGEAAALARPSLHAVRRSRPSAAAERRSRSGAAAD